MRKALLAKRCFLFYSPYITFNKRAKPKQISLWYCNINACRGFRIGKIFPRV